MLTWPTTERQYSPWIILYTHKYIQNSNNKTDKNPKYYVIIVVIFMFDPSHHFLNWCTYIMIIISTSPSISYGENFVELGLALLLKKDASLSDS